MCFFEMLKTKIKKRYVQQKAKRILLPFSSKSYSFKHKLTEREERL